MSKSNDHRQYTLSAGFWMRHSGSEIASVGSQVVAEGDPLAQTRIIMPDRDWLANVTWIATIGLS
jgi:hypothetical protein